MNFDSAVTVLERDLHRASPADEPPIRGALGLAYAGLGRRDEGAGGPAPVIYELRADGTVLAKK